MTAADREDEDRTTAELESLRARVAALESAQQARLEAEVALHTLEERYRVLSELVSDFVYSFEVGPEGELLKVSAPGPFTRITGYETGELKSAIDWMKLVHPDDLPVTRMQFEAVLAGRSDVREFRIFTKGGHLRWVRSYIQPVWDEAHTGVVGAFGAVQDVTDRLQAEAALERSRALLAALHEMDQAMIAAPSAQEVAVAVLARLRQLIPCQRAAITLFDFENRGQVLLSVDPADQAEEPVGHRRPLDASLPLDVFRQGEVYAVEDTQTLAPEDVPLLLRRHGFRSALQAPIRARAELLGMLELAADRPAAFKPEHESIAREVAGSLALVIRQVQLFESERAERLTAQTLAALARDLSATLDLGHIFDLTLEGLQQVVPYDSASLVLLREDSAELAATRGFGDLMVLKRARQAQGGLFPLEREVVVTRAPVIVPDVQRDERWVPVAYLAATHSWLGLPVMTGERVIGLLMLDKNQADFYTPKLADVAQAFAAHAAIAIQNARLLEAEREQRELAEVLRETAVALGESLDVAEVIEKILAQVGRVVPFDSGNVMLVEDGWARVAWTIGYEPLCGPEVARQVEQFAFEISQTANLHTMAETGQPLVIPNTAAYRGWLNPLGIEHLHSWAGAPIHVQGELVAFLSLDKAEPGFYQPRHADRLDAFATQVGLAMQNARLFEQVRVGRERLQVLSQQLIDIQENERRRIALELHDQIGQTLTALKINLQAAQQGAGPGPMMEAIDQSVAIVERAIQQVRSLSLDLRPSMLDDLGLAATLRWYVDRQAQQAGLVSLFMADTLEERPAPAVETACFRVAQEALTNVLRHAAASKVEVALQSQDEGLVLTVRDDGSGFDVPAKMRRASQGESVGLLGMLERVRLLGGDLEIRSNPGQGCEVRAYFPLDPARPLERRKHRRAP